MSSETRAVDLFRQGNPIPSESGGGGPTVDADLYLDSLRRGPHRTPGPGVSPERKAGFRWVAAAAAAVIVGVLVWVTWSMGGDPPPVIDPPVTTSTPTSTSPPSTLDAWEQVPTGVGGQGGEVRTATFAVPFKIDLPVGWHRKRAETSLTYTVVPHRECNETRGPGRICPGELYVLAVETDFDATVGDVQAIPDAILSQAEAVVVGGAPGVTFDLVPSSDQPFIAEPRPDAGPPVLVLPEDVLRVYVVQVGDDVVVVQALALGSTDFLGDLGNVLATLAWRDLR